MVNPNRKLHMITSYISTSNQNLIYRDEFPFSKSESVWIQIIRIK